MSYAIKLVTPPAAEPVSVAEIKLWSRIDIADDDSLVQDLGIAAREYAEEYTGRQFITATWRLSLDRFPLPGYPLTWGSGSFGYQWGRLPGAALAAFRWADRAAVYLPKAPLQSVTSITYVDMTGATQTLDPATYRVVSDDEPARITPAWGNYWPVVLPQPLAAQITYTAGYGSTGAAVPSRVKTAIKMLAAHWYIHREAVGDAPTAEVGLAVHSLLDSVWTGQYT